MKIQRDNFERGPDETNPGRAGERGMATLIFIVLLSIMLVLVMAESSALFHLHHELKFLEQQQIKRLDASQTNSVAVTKPDSK
jgi:hypothetical protein